MAILDFFATHWDSVLLVLLFALLLVLLYIMGQKRIVYKILFSLATEAEKQFGGGTGWLKQSQVIEKIYGMLPGLMKSLVTVKQLEGWVDDGLKEVKKKWEENAKVKAYIEGGDQKSEETQDAEGGESE